jgi:prohibitin 1
MLKLGMVTLGGGVFASNFVFVVDGGERAIIMDAFRGLQPKIHGEGMHFKLPFVQQVKRFEVRTQPFLSPTQTGTKDLQQVNISLRFLFRPIEEQLPTILNTIGTDYDKRILPSIGNEVLKAVVAHYNAEQLISKREEVSNEIRRQLELRAKEFNIILDDVAITDLQFSPEFARAIEAKQVAQ